MLFHNVTCYSDSLLSCVHVNTIDLLNIMCTLVAIGMILGRLECSDNTVTPFIVFGVTYTICEGPKLDALRSQSVTSTYCHMILFINIGNVYK